MSRGVFDAALYGERGGYPPPPPPPPPYLRIDLTRAQARAAELAVWALITVAAVVFLDVRWKAVSAEPTVRSCPSGQVIDLRPNTLLTSCESETPR